MPQLLRQLRLWSRLNPIRSRGSRWRLAGLFGVVLLGSLIVLAVFIGIVIGVATANEKASEVVSDVLGAIFVSMLSIVSVVGASAVYVSLTKTETGVAGDVTEIFS